MTDVNQLIFKEAEFNDRMQAEVIPWLASTAQEDYFEGYDGAKIHCWYAVHPEEKAAIVMVHGFCEYFDKFHEMAYYFYQMGYSFFFIENRGHGFSARFVPEIDRVYIESYDEYVKDLDCYIEKVVKKKSTTGKLLLYAHSMGGAISTLYMEEHPDTFEAAVLSAPMMRVGFRGTPMWMVRTLFVVSIIMRWDKQICYGQHGWDDVYKWETSSAGSQPRYDYGFFKREEVPEYRTYGGTYKWVRESVKGCSKLIKNAEKCTTPILLFQGGKDHMVDMTGHDEFLKKAPNVELFRYESSKHEIFNDHDDVVPDYYRRIFAYYENHTK